MKFKQLYFLVIIMFFSATHAQAQWMKRLESSDDLYKMAKRDIELKKYQKAINECRQGLDESPKNLDIKVLLGRAYSLAGKLDSARLELNEVINKNPRYRDAYIYLINLEAIACNYQQAIEYADLGLKYYPNDRDILLKKLDIYIKEGDWMESDKLAAYMFDHYTSDPFIRSVYIDYKLSLARHYYSHGYIEIALRAYESVLEQDPLNKEAMESIYNLDVKSGNYAKSLTSVNRALLTNPNSYELLLKKLSILEAMSLYIDAIDVLEKLMKLYPGNSEVIRMNSYIRIEAGRYFMKQDALLQFQTVLEREPANKEALNYVINISYSRGLLPEALQYVNLALRQSPNDRELLGKKLGILETMENYGPAAVVAETLYRENPSPAAKEHLMELKTLSARAYMADQEYDSAVTVLNSALVYDRTNIGVMTTLISIFTQQKRYDDALRVADEVLKESPDNEVILYKKIAILDGYQHYTDAAKIAKKLVEKHPKNKYYINSFVDETLAAGRMSMQYEDYYNTINIFREALIMQPDNIDALNYMINMEIATKQYDSASHYVDEGIKYYPESKDFVFKKSIVYNEEKQYREAYAVSGELFRSYPYNIRFKNAYVEQIVNSGKQYLNNNQPDSALVEFRKALAVSPTDTIPLFNIINMLNDRKKYDSALVLVNRGRIFYPVHPYFLLKRAVILESKKDYENAWKAMDTLTQLGLLDFKYVDYKELLYGNMLRNEIGLFYLNSTYDPQTVIGNNSVRRIATIQYSHKFDKGTLTARLNYAGRITGSGYQFELDGTLIHNRRWYSFANIGIGYSDTFIVFPPFKFSYSIFHNFDKGYDGELGFRYIKLDSSNNSVSVLAGVSKEWKYFYFTFKGFLSDMTYQGTTYGPFPSYLLSSRYYINDPHTNFFSAFIGYGNVPDDASRLLEMKYSQSTYKTVSVGAGYQMKLHYRTTLLINYSWYNIEYNLHPQTYKNQYDLYLGLLHKF